MVICENRLFGAFDAFINFHPTTIIEADVIIQHGTAVWDNFYLGKGVVIRPNCIIGEKTFISYKIKIGRGVKIITLATYNFIHVLIAFL